MRARRSLERRWATSAELFLAFIYNAAGIPIAAGAPPLFGILLSPVIAAAAMSPSVSVVANALRLRRARL